MTPLLKMSREFEEYPLIIVEWEEINFRLLGEQNLSTNSKRVCNISHSRDITHAIHSRGISLNVRGILLSGISHLATLGNRLATR